MIAYRILRALGHRDPALAPLKTELAWMALMARAERRLSCIPIIPIGLTFERKWNHAREC